ncbi:penicillin-binding protein PBP1B [Streptococcus entericus]|uniref:penicillin-binding protein PBP1B n=1 Tax=Streptococcus entericus TaxID=155680 RepID=UPI000360B00D|nr:penicillin-binding protein PBP1B [Streptococcus entericus]
MKKSHRKKAWSELTIWDIGSVVLQTVRILSHFLYIIALLFGMMGIGTAFGYLASQIDQAKVPEVQQLVKQVGTFTRISQLTYSDGSLIAAIDTDLLRTPVESSAISDNIKQAIVSTEDENFATHKGVLPKAVLRAALTTILGIGETSGGSTLTQQLIKQQVLGDVPTFKRKSQEMIYALELERHMDKDTILTNYLNVSPFGRNNRGQNIAGIEEAAQGIFGVSAKDLTIPQAAFLAGLPQSPIVYSPYTSDGNFKTPDDMAIGIKRAKNVLYNMYRTGVIDKPAYDDYVAYDITQDFKKPEAIEETNHGFLYYTVMEEAEDLLYDYLLKRDNVSDLEKTSDAVQTAYREKAKEELALGGYHVTTTIHKTVHQAMQDTVANLGHLLDDGTGLVETGNVLMDNRTGAVLGFVGGRNYADNQNNHAFDTKRSPGSTIKSLLPYGIAIDQGLIGSASVLSNYPANFSSGQPILYVGSRGTAAVTLQNALDMSYNIPAFWTYKLLRERGVDVEGYMSKMGYEFDDYSIESLPIGGGAEMSVAQQTNGYQMLANGGIYHKKHVVQKITANDGTVIYEYDDKGERIFSPAGAGIMTHLLRGPLRSGATTAFIREIGALNPQLPNGDWIGKTGTSDENVDSWLMVGTPAVTLGTWAGHDDNSPMSNISGRHTHTYVARLVNAIHQADPSILGLEQRFNLAPETISSSVLTSTGMQAGTVTVNGRQISIGGATTVSYWAKNGAPVTTSDFMVGGSASDRQQAWAAIVGVQTPSPSSASSSSAPSTSSSATSSAPAPQTEATTTGQ